MKQSDYVKELKKQGFLNQVQKDRFSLRLRVAGGRVKAEALKKVYELAERYGAGYVHMTSRQSIEIPFIKLQDIDAVKRELTEAGLEPGAGGARVRTITACQGNAVCRSGLIDTADIADEFNLRYYARELPHKFKLGITGCRNNCLKAEENDLGVKGGMKPLWNEEGCSFCGLCMNICPAKAIKVSKKDRLLNFNEGNCLYCGRCVKACPVNAWEGKPGFIIYFGGLFGNRIAIGRRLLPIIFAKKELHKIVEVTLKFFGDHAKKGERFRNTLDRVGWELFDDTLKEALK
ncbi:dissimilatory sulfite reductase (desulfoviridin) alpha/beta subunit [Anaerobacterium chartisolvens]|uniref:Dissimilatory sulfite reductase (Desulfoviridin) alpha/beta subunit n=1 Tax=Anaerobacterium chartisolvens TaxID=1297424 RepID=A0A369B7G7_9FIRM|nr:4Fe-4S binding protein [Anaerobacterium chartisolvens]RCX17255.1 dissimilatory sulfite reductase (desulfoviridin) alpha/beta subunit [Anaerobacterium chartisolvens]